MGREQGKGKKKMKQCKFCGKPINVLKWIGDDREYHCGDCLFKNNSSNCTDNCEDWLQSEYDEQSKERNTINEEAKENEDIGGARKVKQLLFVEDGSVDMFNLYSQLSGNPEIAIIVYRKNSKMPVLANLEE